MVHKPVGAAGRESASREGNDGEVSDSFGVWRQFFFPINDNFFFRLANSSCRPSFAVEIADSGEDNCQLSNLGCPFTTSISTATV